jgi:hypothetical protein
MRTEETIRPNGRVIRKKFVTPNKDFPKRRAYVILRRHKKTGIIEGLAEASFRMFWSKDLVCVYKPYFSGNGHKEMESYIVSLIFKDLPKNLDKNVKELSLECGEDYEVFKARLGTKKCPIKANWAEYLNPKTRKAKGNISFTIRGE